MAAFWPNLKIEFKCKLSHHSEYFDIRTIEGMFLTEFLSNDAQPPRHVNFNFERCFFVRCPKSCVLIERNGPISKESSLQPVGSTF